MTHEDIRILTLSCTKFFVLVGFIFVFFSVLPSTARAASLNFSPFSGARVVGTTFPVSIYVSSATQAMNASSVEVSFPEDRLEVVSLSKSGSIFSLWPAEPSFSNSQGTVSFEGIVLNPGYIGANGRLLTITFRVRRAGTASLNFSSSSILANDGQGTNIFVSSGSANFNLRDATPIVPGVIPPSEVDGAPSAPQISSLTHPDPNQWYTVNDAKFTWELPADATATRLLVGRAPRATPTIHHSPAISSREILDLEDGIWHFHVRSRNAIGWGEVSNFRFQIDTEKPSRFEITEIKREDLTDPKVRFRFEAEDETSGIDYYEIQVNEDKPQIWRDDGSGIYESPAFGPGRHVLIVKAVDKAGNSLANSVTFEIKAIDVPTITHYPRTLDEGDILKILGKTHFNSDVIVYIRKDGALLSEQHTRSNSLGDFAIVVPTELYSGTHTVTARVKDVRGAQSNESEPIVITIQRSLFMGIASFILEYLLVAILVLLTFGVLVWIGTRPWFKVSRDIRRARRDVRGTMQSSDRTFKIFRAGILRHIKRLQKVKRKLTNEEMEFLREFSDKIKETDGKANEIRDIF